TALAAGDALLLRGTWGALEASLEADPDVLVVHAPELVRRQGVPLGAGAKRALAVLAGMVILLATGAVPPVAARLFAAGAIVLLRVLDMDQVYRAISWTTVVLVAGMIPLSTAMTQTGAAAKLADLLVDGVGGHGGHALLLGLFVLTAVLGQLISNMATALIMIPVALSAAAEVDVSPRPVLMSLTVAAAAAFLTPVATPANLMVMRPGGYRFGDYWKLGLPLLILFGVISVLLVPVIWSFCAWTRRVMSRSPRSSRRSFRRAVCPLRCVYSSWLRRRTSATGGTRMAPPRASIRPSRGLPRSSSASASSA